VQVDADLSGSQMLDVVRSGSSVRVRPRSDTERPGDADFLITVPRWMDVRVEGNQVDVEITDVAGEIAVETVGGDVIVDGGSGLIAVRTIQGEIEIRNAEGRVEAVAVNDGIALENVTGDLYVETTNGDIVMRRIGSASTRASTMNGDILYDGSIRASGRYVFSTHNGDISVAVPADADATVSVSTFQGEFEADFPVQLTGTTQDRQFTFTMGSGSARIELESFNGEILLKRPR
ncbi:MAG: DUF4097 family beta strand repeat-containing protein, partial [Gemmatimonadota bacterium]